jgi:hypothetical protein
MMRITPVYQLGLFLTTLKIAVVQPLKASSRFIAKTFSSQKTPIKKELKLEKTPFDLLPTDLSFHKLVLKHVPLIKLTL